MCVPLVVVVHYLYVFGARSRPAKTNAPLIVDTDAVLAGSITLQRLQPIAGRHPQIVQAAGDLKLSELAASYVGDVDKSPDTIASGQRLSIGALERLDQCPIVTQRMNNVKRD